MKNELGFTLIEMLVVVLIIGILASIALPQYQNAVTKAKVASILPLMRRWHDAMYEYKLQHGDYNFSDASALDVSWPSDWKNWSNNPCGNGTYCFNDYWNEGCFANEEQNGYLYCEHMIDIHNYVYFTIDITPSDSENEYYRNKISCYGEGIEGKKACKSLGWKLDEETEDWVYYILN